MNLLFSPTPRHVTIGEESSPWASTILFSGPSHGMLAPLAPALSRFLEEASALTGTRWRQLEGRERPDAPGVTSGTIHEDPQFAPEAYQLTIGAREIRIICGGWRGAFYALQTLRQVLIQCPYTRPDLVIEDQPALPSRGYLLDISRTRVPTRATLCSLIDQLAGLKFNQLQLYMEHTFAFPGHETVWGEASPLTASDIRWLDTYAAERAIELVPNFNSFGHFERWLRHPEYFPYAECPYGWRRPDGHGMAGGSTLAPSPESRALLASLFQEFLPLFRSRQCNLGGDEPWELGMGRSRERCARDGKHAVYLDFLHQIVDEAAAYKERVQFWADIVLERPEIVPQLDPRLTALVWGYEADHPLAAQAEIFAASGLPFLLCPGTASWNSLGTRLGNARTNIEAAGRAAAAHGAEGLLLTDWGDYGHHQPPVVSLPSLFFAAQAGWAPDTQAPQAEVHVARFGLPSEGARLAPLLFRLGTLSNLIAFRPPNRMPLVALLTAREDQIASLSAQIQDSELQACEAALSDLAIDLAALPLEGNAAEALREDLSVTIGLLGIATQRGLMARELASCSVTELRRAFHALIGRFEECWIRGHRVGGLQESTAWLRRALESLPTEPPQRPAWPPTAWQ